LFLIVIGGILIILIFSAILSKIVKSKRTHAQMTLYDMFCAITPWQRQNIPAILKKNKETKSMAYILKYMDSNKVWYTDEILDVDPDIVIKMDSILFDECVATIQNREAFNNQEKLIYCFLLLNTIDKMNGGLYFNDTEYEFWIDPELAGTDEPDVAMKQLCHYTLEEALNKGRFTQTDIVRTADEILNEPMMNYSEATFAILIISFIYFIQTYYIGKDLNDAGLSYIRALAALLVRKDYLEAVASYVVS
jgi:hypothetical protein